MNWSSFAHHKSECFVYRCGILYSTHVSQFILFSCVLLIVLFVFLAIDSTCIEPFLYSFIWFSSLIHLCFVPPLWWILYITYVLVLSISRSFKLVLNLIEHIYLLYNFKMLIFISIKLIIIICRPIEGFIAMDRQSY